MGSSPRKGAAKSAPQEPLPELNPGDVWYFAFGSNLNPTVLTGRRRVFPRVSLPAKLEGWALSFNLCSVPYIEPGMASLVQLEPGAPPPPMPAAPLVTGAQAHQARLAAGLHGVLHLISASEWEVVKVTEGVKLKGLGYEVVPVRCDSYSGHQVESLTLVSAPASSGDPAGFLPSARYLGLIREGARLHRLDPAYCAMLEAHPVYQPVSAWGARLGQCAMLGIAVAITLPMVPLALASALASATHDSVTGWAKPTAPPASSPALVVAPGALASNPLTAAPAAGTGAGDGGPKEAVSTAALLKATETKAPPGGLVLLWLRQHMPSFVGPYFMFTLSKAMQFSHDLVLKWILGNGYTVVSTAQPQLLSSGDPAVAAIANGKHKAS